MIKQISSLTNQTVKDIRALHMRKEREATGRFLAEGPHDPDAVRFGTR